MMKKFIGKLANAGTVALLGYEMGQMHEKSDEHVENTHQDQSYNNIIVIIALIIIVLLILAKFLIKKRPVERPIV